MAKNKLTIDDLFKIKSIRSIRWSPDGDYAVVVIGSTNVKEQRNETALWLYRSDDHSFRSITRGPNDSNAGWLDNTTILFMAAKRDLKAEEDDKPFGKTRFYTMSVLGGEAMLAAEIEGSVEAWELSPSGKKIALVMSPHPPTTVRQREIWKKAPFPKIGTNLRYKMDAVGYLPDEFPGIFYAKIRKDRWLPPKPVTAAGEYRHMGVQWLDDHRLVFSRWEPNRKDFLARLFLTDLKGNQQELPTYGGEVGDFAISPDGAKVVFCGNPDPRRGGYLPSNIYRRSTDSNDPNFECLTDTIGKFGEQITISDVHGLGASKPLQWLDNENLVALHAIKGRTELVRLNTATGEQQVVSQGLGIVHTFAVNGEQILYARGDYTTIDELYRQGQAKPISNLNSKLYKKFLIPQRWQFESEPGVSIDAWLWATDDQLLAKQKTLPLVLYVHGGPHVQTGEGPFHEYSWLAREGYPVVIANPRGSTGYGAEHGAAIFGNWGDKDIIDILAVREETLKKYPQFDPARIFIAGGSYGGYMTNMMVTRYPDLFRAGITQRSISNFLSFAGTSDFSNYFPMSAIGIENIWENPSKAWEQSPLARAPEVKTPLLIIHSDADHRCPVSQAEELFVALVELGRKIDEEVRLVIFKGESHGLSRGGKPENRKVRLEEILNWLKKHDRVAGKMSQRKKKGIL